MEGNMDGVIVGVRRVGTEIEIITREREKNEKRLGAKRKRSQTISKKKTRYQLIVRYIHKFQETILCDLVQFGLPETQIGIIYTQTLMFSLRICFTLSTTVFSSRIQWICKSTVVAWLSMCA